MTEPVRFSDNITIRVQPEITALVDRAARAKGSKPSEWTRQAILEALRAAGLDPATTPAGDARALYGPLNGSERGGRSFKEHAGILADGEDYRRCTSHRK